MKTYQAEMHCHTREASPCSRIPAKYLVQGYQQAGYRYVFITDHCHPNNFGTPSLRKKSWQKKIDYMMSGYDAAVEYAKGTGLVVLQGMEVVLGYGKASEVGSDFLVYGFQKEFLYDYPNLYDMNYGDFYRLMHENGFLVFQAHPYRYGLAPIEPICYDGVEAVNAHSEHLSHNKKAIQYAAEHNIYVISGSDAHTEEDIGRGGIMLPGDIETPMDVVQYIKENGSPELIVTFGA